ncbi:hypothetical protein PYCC9005_005641 [Savitreella phatthalungensis]
MRASTARQLARTALSARRCYAKPVDVPITGHPPTAPQPTPSISLPTPPPRPKDSAHDELKASLSKRLLDSTLPQTSPTFSQLLTQLDDRAGFEIQETLSNGNRGTSLPLDDVSKSLVTVAHVFPSADPTASRAVYATGFAIGDGSLVVTCAHPFHQLAAATRSFDGVAQMRGLRDGRCVVIGCEGDVIPVVEVASHLVVGDLVILRVAKPIQPLPVDPYPSPTGTTVLHFDAGRPDPSTGAPHGTWVQSELALYQDRRGREAETGTYDELNTLLFRATPSQGSSGAPVLAKPSNAVIGIVRGTEVTYHDRKLRGFGTPAEALFHAFKLV